MIRNEVKAEYLGKRVRVLNKGYVELCDYLGDDESIVRCARESYNRHEDELTQDMIDGQIKEMLRNGHTSPFEQAVFKFHIKMPIFVQRQLIRHRTARINELSGRYTKFAEDNFYIPDSEVLNNRAAYEEESGKRKENKSELVNDVIRTVVENNALSYSSYSKLYDKQVPKEIARVILPLTTFTEFFWQIDLHNLLHFLKLRLDEHAQKEIRIYAHEMLKIVNGICPISIKHFMNYQFNALTLSSTEAAALSSYFNNINAGNQNEKPSMTDEIGIIIDKINKHEHRTTVRNKYLFDGK
jgi:thymidylate synthase (FAD)